MSRVAGGRSEQSIPIVLLPGLDGTGDLFERFASLAPPQFEPRIIRLPQLGSYAELLDYVRAQLPRDGRFAVLGESFSGPLAIEVARHEADRVDAVVLCNSFVSAPLSPLLRYLPWSLLLRVPPPKWVIRRFLVGTDAGDELVMSVQSAIAKTPAAILAKRMRAVFSLRAPSHIEVPVLVLASVDDAMVRVKTEAIQSIAPVVVVKTIPGPHLLLQAAPERAWPEIAAFTAGR